VPRGHQTPRGSTTTGGPSPSDTVAVRYPPTGPGSHELPGLVASGAWQVSRPWHNRRAMAELHFFTGTMDSGKSTLALQTNHNHAARGRVGRIFTTHDRAGEAILSSRLGLTHDAIEVEPDFDFWRYVVDSLTAGARIDYLVCDEAQFYTAVQIDQLAKIVDELQIDVFAFGILSDFRTKLFPGSARLVELADRMNVLQVEALCWCGKRATHNARTEDGVMVVEGEVIVVGDVDSSEGPPAEVAYEVLCRQHHRRRLTAARARAVALSPEPLPFGS
jgi:thymidine kinase